MACVRTNFGQQEEALSVGAACRPPLRKDVKDEVAESFGVLFGVDRGDFSAGLQQRGGNKNK